MVIKNKKIMALHVYTEENILTAIENSNSHLINEYLQLGLDIDYVFHENPKHKAFSLTLVHYTVVTNNSDIIKLLIAKGCNVNKAMEIIHTKHGEPSIKCKKHENKLHFSCLYRALCQGNSGVIQLLIDAGADVNLYDKSCCSALWHAVDINNILIAKKIMSTPGCWINASDIFKMSPLHVAVVHQNAEMAEALIKQGARIDMEQCQGLTPLALASTF